MLLGELYTKRDILLEQIKDIKKYLKEIDVVESNYKEVTSLLETFVVEYENCDRVINENTSNIQITMDTDKVISFTKTMVMYNTLLNRMGITSCLIRNKFNSIEITAELIKQKGIDLREYLYINSIINKALWTVEIDN